MNKVASVRVKWGVVKVLSLLSEQGKLTYEQRLHLKDDGRPCPEVSLTNRSCHVVYDHFSWICGDEVKNMYFCWPCLVMGDRQKVRLFVNEIYCKAVDTFYVFESPELKEAAILFVLKNQ